jgi:hypothetical protein
VVNRDLRVIPVEHDDGEQQSGEGHREGEDEKAVGTDDGRHGVSFRWGGDHASSRSSAHCRRVMPPP